VDTFRFLRLPAAEEDHAMLNNDKGAGKRKMSESRLVRMLVVLISARALREGRDPVRSASRLLTAPH
jgi:hypothetical protein